MTASHPGLPLCAEDLRRRRRVQEIAYKAFADEGFSVTIAEIARRARMSQGTLYRLFASKDDLVRSFVVDRLERLADEAVKLMRSCEPGEALFQFLGLLVLQWGIADVGLQAALIGCSNNIEIDDARGVLVSIVEELLTVAQDAGTARLDIRAMDVMTVIVGCHGMLAYNHKSAAHAIVVLFESLRTQSDIAVLVRSTQ